MQLVAAQLVAAQLVVAQLVAVSLAKAVGTQQVAVQLELVSGNVRGGRLQQLADMTLLTCIGKFTIETTTRLD